METTDCDCDAEMIIEEHLEPKNVIFGPENQFLLKVDYSKYKNQSEYNRDRKDWKALLDFTIAMAERSLYIVDNSSETSSEPEASENRVLLIDEEMNSNNKEIQNIKEEIEILEEYLVETVPHPEETPKVEKKNYAKNASSKRKSVQKASKNVANDHQYSSKSPRSAIRSKPSHLRASTSSEESVFLEKI